MLTRRTLIFDLEGVLISTYLFPIIHPQARAVLERAQHDFARVFCWSTGPARDVRKVVEQQDWQEYFFAIIGGRAFHPVERGVVSPTPWFYVPSASKDLDKLPGRASDYVIIDDKPHLCFPPDRVIDTPSFYGMNQTNLHAAYDRALALALKNGNPNPITTL